MFYSVKQLFIGKKCTRITEQSSETSKIITPEHEKDPANWFLIKYHKVYMCQLYKTSLTLKKKLTTNIP